MQKRIARFATPNSSDPPPLVAVYKKICAQRKMRTVDDQEASESALDHVLRQFEEDNLGGQIDPYTPRQRMEFFRRLLVWVRLDVARKRKRTERFRGDFERVRSINGTSYQDRLFAEVVRAWIMDSGTTTLYRNWLDNRSIREIAEETGETISKLTRKVKMEMKNLRKNGESLLRYAEQYFLKTSLSRTVILEALDRLESIVRP